jgi:uncharacterized protein (DUF58 family)
MPTAAAPPRGHAEPARAARLLVLRSRFEAVGLFAGNYRSAFRGGGLEYEESRPYAPGDDVRCLDWSATARTGRPFVKIFREERDRTLLLALDVSGSMGFGSAGGSKAATAAHALALLAAAAGRAGDRVGLLAFDARPRAEVRFARGRAHGARVIRAAALAASDPGGPTDLAEALRALRRRRAPRGIVVLLSDFRDPRLLAGDAGSLRAELTALATGTDLVAAIVVDPREQSLPAAGRLALHDAERPERSLSLASGSARARARYAEAAARWRERLARELRGAGAEALWLHSDRSPLLALARFFQERAASRRRTERAPGQAERAASRRRTE